MVTVKKKTIKNEWLTEIGRRRPVSLAMIQCHGDVVTDDALRDLFKEVAPKLKVCIHKHYRLHMKLK